MRASGAVLQAIGSALALLGKAQRDCVCGAVETHEVNHVRLQVEKAVEAKKGRSSDKSAREASKTAVRADQGCFATKIRSEAEANARTMSRTRQRGNDFLAVSRPVGSVSVDERRLEGSPPATPTLAPPNEDERRILFETVRRLETRQQRAFHDKFGSSPVAPLDFSKAPQTKRHTANDLDASTTAQRIASTQMSLHKSESKPVQRGAPGAVRETRGSPNNVDDTEFAHINDKPPKRKSSLPYPSPAAARIKLGEETA